MPVENRAIDGRAYREVSWTRLRAESGPIYGREHMKHIVGICSLCLLLVAGPANGAECDNWNTKEFFKTATPKAVTGCLQAGADPKARDEAVGGTPLHWAARFNENPAVITALLDAGADPKARDEFFGAPPLHQAAGHNNNPAVITALLNAGANPNARDKSGATSLHWAAGFSQHPAVIAALLDAGADTAAQDEKGHVPSDYAEKNEALQGSDVYWRLKAGRF